MSNLTIKFIIIIYGLIILIVYFFHLESPLVRGKACLEDSPGRGSDGGSSKGSLSHLRSSREGDLDDDHAGSSNEAGGSRQDETSRRRELALRQHAFFQLRLHIRRGANLVAMDRCGELRHIFHWFSLKHRLFDVCHRLVGA